MNKDITVGIDLGDKRDTIYAIDGLGQELARCEVENTVKGLSGYFKDKDPLTVVMEAGTHSPWISRLLKELGHEVLIGNPRKLRAIWDDENKNDGRDAEMLARIGRFDRKLLRTIEHRGQKAQQDFAMMKSRDALVSSRANLIGHVRGIIKSQGLRIAKSHAEGFTNRARELSEEVLSHLEPVLEVIDELSKRIKGYDKKVERMSREQYPETERVRQIAGVGPVTALSFVLCLEESSRFRRSRSVGAFFGLTPRRDQSGELDKQLRITKAGDQYLRRLLVGCANYILGPFGPDCNLRRSGLRLCSRGGKNARRRAKVAVARKLAVLMHKLWASGDIYDPFYRKVKQAA